MTDDAKGAVGPQGRPWSVDVLADLHAGVLDPAESERLLARVRTDPDARAVLDALDSVTTDLGQLSATPVEPMPARFVARLDAAIEAETRASGRTATATQPTPAVQPVAPVVDLAAARRRRNRIAGWGAGVLTAAAAAAAIAIVAIPDSTGGAPVAEPPRSTDASGDTGQGAQPPMALTENDLGSATKLIGETDYGQLESEQGLRDCLESHDVTMGGPLGVGPVTYEGKDAIAAIVGAGSQAGKYRVIVVEATCSDVFANTEIG